MSSQRKEQGCSAHLWLYKRRYGIPKWLNVTMEDHKNQCLCLSRQPSSNLPICLSGLPYRFIKSFGVSSNFHAGSSTILFSTSVYFGRIINVASNVYIGHCQFHFWNKWSDLYAKAITWPTDLFLHLHRTIFYFLSAWQSTWCNHIRLYFSVIANDFDKHQ